MLQDGASRILEDERVKLEFNANAAFTSPNRNIPNILGFRARETPFGIHGGNEYFEDRRISGDFPNDLSGITLVFVYTDLIEYQNTASVKAPILRIIDSGKCVDNSLVVTTQGLERRSILIYNTRNFVQNIQTNQHTT